MFVILNLNWIITADNRIKQTSKPDLISVFIFHSLFCDAFFSLLHLILSFGNLKLNSSASTLWRVRRRFYSFLLLLNFFHPHEFECLPATHSGCERFSVFVRSIPFSFGCGLFYNNEHILHPAQPIIDSNWVCVKWRGIMKFIEWTAPQALL